MNGRTKFSLHMHHAIWVFPLLLLCNSGTLLASSWQEFFNENPDSGIAIRQITPARGAIAHDTIAGEEPSKQENIAETERSDSLLQWHTMITKLPSDWSSFISMTFRVESIPAIATVAGVTGALYIIDQDMYGGTRDYETGSRHYRSVSGTFIALGDGKYQFGFVGCVALYGFSAKDFRALRTASQMTEAILATGIVVQVLKRLTGRESPIVATENRGALRPFPNLADYERHQPRYYSFPSGHIATTTAALTVLCENYPKAKWLRPVSFVVVGAVGGSLVSKGWHWYSDLPLGIVLGYSFGMIAAHPEKQGGKKGNRDASPDLSLTPRIDANGTGIELILRF